MEPGFVKANSANLPRLDLVMLCNFLGSNKDFCSSEYRNVKTSLSSRPSYGDDAISYVQLERRDNICTVKCKICPEHKVHSKLYAITLVVDERAEKVTAKDLSKGSQPVTSDSSMLLKFLEEGRKRNLKNCELIEYQPTYSDRLLSLSMHELVLAYREESSEKFLEKINIQNEIIKDIEEETREQSQSKFWYELRYGRITASKAYDVSRCKKVDGTLISAIMGGKTVDTPAMKRGRLLEEEVRKTICKKSAKVIKKCGLFISRTHPMLAGSPDGICEDSVVEIKCPINAKTKENYIKNGEATKKCFAQMQMQMFLSGRKKCLFCVADPNFSANKNVEIICVPFEENFTLQFIKSIISFWKLNVYPLLFKSIE